MASYVVLGAAMGLVATWVTRGVYAVEDAFERLPIHWMWWPAIGGLVVGVGGLIEPRALGVGYDVINDLLSGHLLIKAVVLILLVKAVVWLTALASGTSGGVLAPLLILGGALGWLIGLFLPGTPQLWALLGMAAMLGGTMRAPLTGAVFALELTGDLDLLAPLLTAAVAAFAVTVLVMKRSILTEKIARRGQHITREYGSDPFELARVGEVMAKDVETLSTDLSIEEAVQVLEAGRHRSYPVVDLRGRPVGMVSRVEALEWAVKGSHAEERLGERVSDAALPVVYPEDVAIRAIDLMLSSGYGRLPVVDRRTAVLLGLVTRKDLLKVRASVARTEGERAAYFGPSGRPAEG
jgi:CBS domain-containing protein